MTDSNSNANSCTEIDQDQLETDLVHKQGTAIELKEGVHVPSLIIESNGTQKKYSLPADSYLIGRSPKCDIQINHAKISRVSVSIERVGESDSTTFRIEDKGQGSSNGIYFRRKKITSRILKHGNVISLGPPELADIPTIIFDNPPPKWKTRMRYGLYGIGAIVAILMGAIIWEANKVSVKPLPSGVIGPTVIQALNGVALNPFQQETHRELDSLEDFSPALIKALLSSEDSRFYWHPGVDLIGTLRAILVNSQGKKQGGSTLTQQLARSLFPEVGRDNTLARKWRELAVALKLEAVYSKNDLLKTYLNRVYLGQNHYGFEDAAQFYFDKSAKDLDIAQSATLVAMLPAPNLYNPVRDLDRSIKKRDIVIKKMGQTGVISEKEASRALRSRIQLSPKARQSSITAPYFYNYALTEMEQILGEELSSKGNFIVETTLDLSLQRQAEQTLQKNIDKQGKRFNYTQGALVSLDTRTGEIRAMVGGKDYKTSQYNRAVQAKRQPASTFKVFPYLAALEQGISPYQTFSCNPLLWEGQRFNGCKSGTKNLDMMQGLARSENAVALRVAQQVGLDSVSNLAKRFGITSELTESPGLVLGQSETTVLAMTGAYGAIANQGIWHKPHGIRRILDGGDCQNYDQPQTCRVIYDVEDEPHFQHQAVSEDVARTMMAMLRQPVIAGTAQAANRIPNALGKTGTTNKGVDLWFMGILPQRNLVTGIWLGNDNNQPTRGSSAQAVTLWTSYSQQILNP